MIPLLLMLTLAILAGYYFYPGKKLQAGTVINKLVVYKSKRRMEAWSNGRLVKTYIIALGKDPIGHKEFEGDYRTPEGTYTINDRNPNSAYHKNLGVSYPDTDDIAHAKAISKPPGGDIKIHGLRNGRGAIGKFHRFKDWTHGCIAVTNDEIDELFTAVAANAIIEIYA